MITLLITIALIGLIVYLITAFVPMPEPFKIVIYVIAAIFVILVLMRALGIADPAVPQL